MIIHNHPSSLPTAAWAASYVDGCPKCVATYNRPVAAVKTVDCYGERDGLYAAYHCPGCDHYWITSWAYEPGWEA